MIATQAHIPEILRMGREFVAQTTDIEYVTRIALDEDVYHWIIDDYSAGWTPELNGRCIYLRNAEGGALGVFHPINSVCWKVHVAMTKTVRSRSRLIAASAIDWIFSNTNCRKIVGMIPASNRGAIALAKLVGMKPQGVISDAFQRNGKLEDLHIYGVSK